MQTGTDRPNSADSISFENAKISGVNEVIKKLTDAVKGVENSWPRLSSVQFNAYQRQLTDAQRSLQEILSAIQNRTAALLADQIKAGPDKQEIIRQIMLAWGSYRAGDRASAISVLISITPTTAADLITVQRLAALVDALPETGQVVLDLAELGESPEAWLRRVQKVVSEESATLAQLRLLGRAYCDCDKDSLRLKLRYIKKMLPTASLPQYQSLPEKPVLPDLKSYEQYFKNLVQSMATVDQNNFHLPEDIDILPGVLQAHHWLGNISEIKRYLRDTARQFSSIAQIREGGDYKKLTQALKDAAEIDNDERPALLELGRQAQKIVDLLAQTERGMMYGDLDTRWRNLLDILLQKARQAAEIDRPTFEPWAQKLAETNPEMFNAWGAIERLNQQRKPEEAMQLAERTLKPVIDTEWCSGMPLLGQDAGAWWTEFTQQQEHQIDIKQCILDSVAAFKAGAYPESGQGLASLRNEEITPVYQATVKCLQLALNGQFIMDRDLDLPDDVEIIRSFTVKKGEIEKDVIDAFKFTQRLITIWQQARELKWKTLESDLLKLVETFEGFQSKRLEEIKRFASVWADLQRSHWRSAQHTLIGEERWVWLAPVTQAIDKICLTLDQLETNGYESNCIRNVIAALPSSIRTPFSAFLKEFDATETDCTDLNKTCSISLAIRGVLNLDVRTIPKWEDELQKMVAAGAQKWPEWSEKESAHIWLKYFQVISALYEIEKEDAHQDLFCESFKKTRAQIRVYRSETGDYYHWDPIQPFYTALIKLDHEEVGWAIENQKWEAAGKLIETYQLTHDRVMALIWRIPAILQQAPNREDKKAAQEIALVAQEMARLDASHEELSAFWTREVSQFAEALTVSKSEPSL